MVWFLTVLPETGSVFTGALRKKRKRGGGKKRDKEEKVL